ncbi:MAG TPA: tannase/feruloyl esterase family alpha/beta hydrolase [Bryobacteraceae bacterium]|nr:tannase/feruloyl esterase family alpha/beta hydrolase [Bryobacteraceae bacterium]
MNGSIRLLILFAAAGVAAYAQTPNKCAELSKFQMPGSNIEIARAEMVAAGPAPGGRGGQTGPVLPTRCRVDGIIDRRTGPDGKTYGIRFAVALPENWTGQFVQQGGGGLNGTVAEPTGAQAAGEKPAVSRGIAVATSDTGHQSSGGGFDGSFMQDQQATLDFEFIAIGRLTVVAKQIIQTYYGRAPEHSYYVGCSTGGREGMLMTQRYPLYFDGVVAGSPAMRTGHSNLATRSVTVALNAIAPKDDKGKPGPALSASDKKAVIAKLLQDCDARDGAADGMIFDALGCSFHPRELQCAGAKAEGCLSPEQVAAIEKGFAGPKDSKGRQVYPGFFYDTGISAQGGGIPGLLNPGPSPVGGPTAATTQDVDAEAAVADNNPVGRIGDSYSWVNLNSFSSHGGKLIFYHGLSDPWFSAKDTLDYYQRMTAANGGDSKVRDFSRVFLSPGMGHCGGGTGALDTFDMLSASVEWVEKGKAPESVTATGRAFPGRSRPLCAYPAHAQYKGQGSMEDAANFECRQ